MKKNLLMNEKIKKFAGILSDKEAESIRKYARKLRKEAKIIRPIQKTLRKNKKPEINLENRF